jgi:hypothetical protein
LTVSAPGDGVVAKAAERGVDVVRVRRVAGLIVYGGARDVVDDREEIDPGIGADDERLRLCRGRDGGAES